MVTTLNSAISGPGLSNGQVVFSGYALMLIGGNVAEWFRALVL